MRRFAIGLAAAFLALAISVPGLDRSAYADGITDVPPTAIAPALGQLIVYERSSINNLAVYQNSWNGNWSGWSLVNKYGLTPQTMPGNLSVQWNDTAAAFTQLSDGHLYCGSTGLPWAQMATGQFFDTEARGSTPAVLRENTATDRILALGNSVAGGGYRVLTAEWPIGFNPSGCNTLSTTSLVDTGGVSSYTPGLAGTGPNDFLMSVIGTDSHVWWNYNDIGGWHSTVGQGQSAVCNTTWGGGRYDLFVRGLGNDMWHASDPNTWEGLGGQFIGGPACAAWSSGRLDVFGVGLNAHVWHNSWQGNWNGWEDIGTA